MARQRFQREEVTALLLSQTSNKFGVWVRRRGEGRRGEEGLLLLFHTNPNSSEASFKRNTETVIIRGFTFRDRLVNVPKLTTACHRFVPLLFRKTTLHQHRCCTFLYSSGSSLGDSIGFGAMWRGCVTSPHEFLGIISEDPPTHKALQTSQHICRIHVSLARKLQILYENMS